LRHEPDCRGPLYKRTESVEEMTRTRVLLADDDLQMQASINTLLQADFEIVGTASDGYSLIEAALKLRPDVIVTDISMPGMNGFEAVRTIRQILPDIKLIFFTMHNGSSYRREARSIGAAGYVLKSAAREELNQAVQNAMEGAR